MWRAITALTIRFTVRLSSGVCCGWVSCSEVLFERPVIFTNEDYADGVFCTVSAIELEECCNGVPTTTSGFISKHVSESTQNFESDWFLPPWERGTCASMA
jgi:hypothetical protein